MLPDALAALAAQHHEHVDVSCCSTTHLVSSSASNAADLAPCMPGAACSSITDSVECVRPISGCCVRGLPITCPWPQPACIILQPIPCRWCCHIQIPQHMISCVAIESILWYILGLVSDEFTFSWHGGGLLQPLEHAYAACHLLR